MIRSRAAGFTLIELVVVTGIVALVSGFLIARFSRSSVGVAQTAAIIEAELRDIQTRALAGLKFQGKHRCGYGVTDLNATSMQVYTSLDASDIANKDCTQQNRNAGPNEPIVRIITVPDPKVELKDPGTRSFFPDIFFEPPSGRAYLNNDTSAAAGPSGIILGPVGTDCAVDPSSCRTICVYSSGRIETVVGVSCP